LEKEREKETKNGAFFSFLFFFFSKKEEEKRKRKKFHIVHRKDVRDKVLIIKVMIHPQVHLRIPCYDFSFL